MLNKIIVITFFFLCTCHISAQNWQTVEEVDSSCANILGFASDQEAEKYISLILTQVGVHKNTIAIKSCLDIKNCVARILTLKDAKGKSIKKPYIIYDPKFINRIEDQTGNTKWASIAILAHEIGHHYYYHSLNNEGSNHTVELEADEFSGFILAKLGATLEQALSAVNTLPVHGSASHPPLAQRKQAIERGWNRGKKDKQPEPKTEEEKVKQALAEADMYFFNEEYTKAFEIYNKYRLTVFLSSNQMFAIGWMYYHGRGITQDYGYASHWYRNAANSGDVNSMVLLGGMYYKGQGVTQSFESALSYYKKAADFGNDNAMTLIATMYYNGFGVAQNYDTTSYWLQKAADLGNETAMYLIGSMCLLGKGEITSYSKCISWLKIAAQNGSKDAQDYCKENGFTW